MPLQLEPIGSLDCLELLEGPPGGDRRVKPVLLSEDAAELAEAD
jgi:hypothetical protein